MTVSKGMPIALTPSPRLTGVWRIQSTGSYPDLGEPLSGLFVVAVGSPRLVREWKNSDGKITG